MEKTYVVVRNDIRPGLQIAQACHAAIEFTQQHGVLSDNLVVLQVENEAELRNLVHLLYADEPHRRLTRFREPDLGDQMTAIALDGSAGPILSGLKLALRSRRSNSLDAGPSGSSSVASIATA